ncbi:hypothetical protein ABFS82_06G122100 [Erythranthe guttata]
MASQNLIFLVTLMLIGTVSATDRYKCTVDEDCDPLQRSLCRPGHKHRTVCYDGLCYCGPIEDCLTDKDCEPMTKSLCGDYPSTAFCYLHICFCKHHPTAFPPIN